MIIALRTESPDAQVYVVDGKGAVLAQRTWHADRTLARDLLKVIAEQLEKADVELASLKGVVVFVGPGSFTGLRIGITVANALAYAQQVPVVGEQGDNWMKNGIVALAAGRNDRLVLPHYGGEAHITAPKK